MDDLDKILEFIYTNYDRFPMTLSAELRAYIRQLKKEKEVEVVCKHEKDGCCGCVYEYVSINKTCGMCGMEEDYGNYECRKCKEKATGEMARSK